MKNSPKIAGVIGLGVGMQHALAYQSLGLNVVFTDFNTVLDVPSDFIRVEDWRAVVDCSDIVSVCSWDQYHEEQVIYALEQDKHVLCEKPLAHTRGSLERIRVAAEKSKGSLEVSFPLQNVFPKYMLMGADRADFTYVWGRNYKLHDGWRKDVPKYNVTCGGLIHMIELCESVYEKIDGRTVEILSCFEVSKKRAVDYDEIIIRCKTINSRQIYLYGHFSGNDGNHWHRIEMRYPGFSIEIENDNSVDKGWPARCFYENITNPIVEYTPDPFSANETAITIHEKSMEYLHGKD